MSMHWLTVRLGDVIQEKREPVGKLNGNSFPVLGVTNVEGVTKTGVEASEDRSKYLRLRPGYFVYNPYRVNVGSLGVSSETQDGIVSPAYVVFAPTERINHKFLYYFLKSPRGSQLINFYGNRGSVRSALRFSDLCQIEISLPQIEEQRRIVARIGEIASQVHEAIALRQQAEEEAEILVDSHFRAVFDALEVQHGKTKLDSLIVDAGYGSSYKCYSERTEGMVPVLRIPNVASEKVSLDNLKYTHLSVSDRDRLFLKRGDILVVRTNGSINLVGRSAVVEELPEPTAFASYIIRLRFDTSRIFPAYGQKILRHLRVSGQLINLARTTAGQYNVSLGRLRSAEIPVPLFSTQQQIVYELDTFYTQIEALKQVQSKTAAELDALLPSILDRAFKGEL